MAVLEHYNFHYAPTVKTVRNTLKNADFKKLRGSSVPLNISGTIESSLFLNLFFLNQKFDVIKVVLVI